MQLVEERVNLADCFVCILFSLIVLVVDSIDAAGRSWTHSARCRLVAGGWSAD